MENEGWLDPHCVLTEEGIVLVLWCGWRVVWVVVLSPLCVCMCVCMCVCVHVYMCVCTYTRCCALNFLFGSLFYSHNSMHDKVLI